MVRVVESVTVCVILKIIYFCNGQFGNEVIAQNVIYTDNNNWKITVNFQEPDNDRIQSVSSYWTHFE